MNVIVLLVRLPDGPASLEVRIKAEEEVLAEAFRAADVSRLADPLQPEPCETLSPVSAMIQSLVPAPQTAVTAEAHLVAVCSQISLLVNEAATGQRNSHAADLKSVEQRMRWLFLIRNVCYVRLVSLMAANRLNLSNINIHKPI